jgi:hypothetical protein
MRIEQRDRNHECSKQRGHSSVRTNEFDQVTAADVVDVEDVAAPSALALSTCRGSSPLHRASLTAPNEQLIARFRASIMCSERCPFLLTCDEVARALRIGLEDAKELIATKQLASVIIAGHELVPVRELVELIDDYVAISKRSCI